jgi:flagellar hook-associated protein 3 FlgL
MQINSLGDMARTYSMQSRNTALKQDLQRLTVEISTGQIADLRYGSDNNTFFLNDMGRSLKKLDGYALATQEAGQFISSIQSTLGRIGDMNSSFQSTLMTASNKAFGDTSSRILSEAKTTLGQVINAMNTSTGGRTVFAGISTDILPVAPQDDILSAVSAAMAGAGNVDDMLAAAQAWFEDPAGYSAIGYRGATTSLAPVTLSDSDTVQFDFRGDDPALRDILRNLVVIALADDPALGFTQAQQSELFQKSLNAVLDSSTEMVNLQAQVGFSEARIEALTVRHSTERASLEMARNDLLSVDPYQSATELEQVQFQLQSLYAITSRMSQLSLVNYL